jgi:hypothetical protein
MSDYLSNLVARSFDRASLIQPRLASRFEPQSGLHEPLVESFLELAAERQSQQLSVYHAAPQAVHPQAVRPQIQPPEQSLPAILQPEVPGLMPSTSMPQTRSNPSRPISHSESSLSSQARSLASTRLPIQPQAALRSEVHPPVASNQISRPEVVSAPIPSPGPLANLPALQIQPQIVSLAEQKPSPIQSEVETKLPTIQVRIGQIEVRAIAAPPSARQSAKPPAPRLSLEDYLKSRNGGKG